MKVNSPLAGFIGAIPGAMPFMLGWVALQGKFGLEPGVFLQYNSYGNFLTFGQLLGLDLMITKKQILIYCLAEKKIISRLFKLYFIHFV